MSQNNTTPSFGAFIAYLRQLQKAAFEISVQALLNSVPLIGSELARSNRMEIYIDNLFKSDDEIQNDIQKVAQYMLEIEEIMARLNFRIEHVRMGGISSLISCRMSHAGVTLTLMPASGGPKDTAQGPVDIRIHDHKG